MEGGHFSLRCFIEASMAISPHLSLKGIWELERTSVSFCMTLICMIIWLMLKITWGWHGDAFPCVPSWWCWALRSFDVPGGARRAQHLIEERLPALGCLPLIRGISMIDKQGKTYWLKDYLYWKLDAEFCLCKQFSNIRCLNKRKSVLSLHLRYQNLPYVSEKGKTFSFVDPACCRFWGVLEPFVTKGVVGWFSLYWKDY